VRVRLRKTLLHKKRWISDSQYLSQHLEETLRETAGLPDAALL